VRQNSFLGVLRLQQAAEMNETGFSDDDNDTFVGNRSVEQYDEPWFDWNTMQAVRDIIRYVVLALGVPGNVLSAIVWLRRHIASENPSAIYLAALAINDIVLLIVLGVERWTSCYTRVDGWLCRFIVISIWSTLFLEPLLVLTFSVVRLIAIRRPLQVYLMLQVLCILD